MISSSMTSLLDWVKDILGIASPSKLFAQEIGLPLAQGIAQGFAQGLAATGGAIGRSLSPRQMVGAITHGGGGGVNLVLNYSPGVAIADRQDVETRLVPYIKDAMRRIR